MELDESSNENTPQVFISVLLALGSPDNSARHTAEHNLHVLMQNPFFADLTLAALTTCQAQQRTMCAVLFAKYCRDRTRLVRDTSFQTAYRHYF